jgi:hypothetical protein
MKKTVWLVFGISLVLVNVLAIGADYWGGVYIALPYRLAIVLAATLVTIIFSGAWQLMKTAESEKPPR